jgi:hypothetical protein
MLDSCPTYVPIHEGIIFNMDTAPDDPTPYPHLVGKLLYLLCMHLDIAYVVNVVNRDMQALEVAHLQIVLSMFHYLRHYPSCGIYYIEREVNTLWGYINVNFAQDADDQCSTCAYILMLGSSPIS